MATLFVNNREQPDYSGFHFLSVLRSFFSSYKLSQFFHLIFTPQKLLVLYRT